MIPLAIFSTLSLNPSLQVVHLNVVYKKANGISMATNVRLERANYRNGRWAIQSVPVSGFEQVVFPNKENIAASEKFTAFCSSKSGKNGITIVDLKGHCQFVPIPERIFGLEFPPDGESVLVVAKRSSGPFGYISTLIRLGNSGEPRTYSIRAWIASPCETGLAGVDEKGDVRIWKDTGPVNDLGSVKKLQLLLKERTSERVQPKSAVGSRGSKLPSTGPSYTKEYLVSRTLKSMFEMRLSNPGLPIGQSDRLDGTNDFSEDGIFQSGRGVIWRITRPDGWGYCGKSLTDSHFRFMSVVPLKMGKKQPKSYAPGIYDVDFVNSNVLRLAPLPLDLAKTKDDRAWTLVH